MGWQDRISIGTSGYNYRGWVGSFYPEGSRARRLLPIYAETFSTVELNFTYYGIPSPSVIRRMVDETPRGFGFFVKAFRGITHDREPEKHIAPFLRCLEPAREEDRLRGVLLQFPQSFHNTFKERELLRSISDLMEGIPLVAEVRHSSWIRRGFFDLLRGRGIAFCCVDEPDLPGLVPPLAIATTGMGYIRFHSRSRANWYSGDARYDYLYSEEELRSWIPRLQALARMATRTYVFFNNCHGAQAARNALHLKRLLGQDTRPPIRPLQASLFT